MFQAAAASLRSSDMGRQVGAVIASVNGDVVAIGANEVPFVTGGLTWPGDSPDRRDHHFGTDPANEHKRDLIFDVLQLLKGHLSEELKNYSVDELARHAAPALLSSKLMGIQEFGRPVHAEMAALLDGAMRGVSVSDKVLCATTFPCHNCAKHIIASGIRVVIFLEPYPKSLVTKLFDREFQEVTQPSIRQGGWDRLLTSLGLNVGYCAYLGVAPRCYFQLFKMVRRKDADGNSLAAEWQKHKTHALPRFPMPDAHLSYIPRELREIDSIRDVFR